MVARKQVDACMICDPEPCTCFAKPVKATAPRKRPVAPVPEVQSVSEPRPDQRERPDFKAAMKAAAQASPVFIPQAPVARAKKRSSEGGFVSESAHTLPPSRPAQPALPSAEDLLLYAALRSLRGMLSNESMTEWGMVVNSEPSKAERAAEWKARRACL